MEYAMTVRAAAPFADTVTSARRGRTMLAPRRSASATAITTNSAPPPNSNTQSWSPPW